VLGTQDSTPLEFWVAVEDGQYLQLDDVVHVTTPLPSGRDVQLYGVVDLVRARHEGARFDSDVFLVEQGVLPANVAHAAHVKVTRVEPEIYVPPRPGRPVHRASGNARADALFFDRMQKKVPIGLSRDGEPVFANLEFLDGTRGAHVNISGISGVATKTSYATFLLHSLFAGDALGAAAANTHAIVFNVKGEDLLFLDQRNAALPPDHGEQYGRLGLPALPFRSVRFLAPAGRGSLVPQTGSRTQGVTAFLWTLREFAEQRLLRYLFADADAETSQLGYVVDRVEGELAAAARAMPRDAATLIVGEGDERRELRDFAALVDCVAAHAERWTPRAAAGTVAAFERRLRAAAAKMGFLVRGDGAGKAGAHRLDFRQSQVTVVDLHRLHDKAQRFVVGSVLDRLFEEKETSGSNLPLVFVVLDELNKYCPASGHGPLKDMLIDVAERGRSLGIVLIGAQQTASEVESRIVANAALRVVGRLDTAEAERPEYGFLGAAGRARAGILKQGTMIVQQPEVPAPLLLRFPFPAWATKRSEVAAGPPDAAQAFAGL
jgi:DNA helicase HerA-like ATPase